MLLRKKQVITIVSIAVISFLIGTTFNAITIAFGGGNPWNKVWTAIYGLQVKVEELEDQMLPQGFVNAPAYDSGWVKLEPGESKGLTLPFDGEGTLFVYVLGYNDIVEEFFTDSGTDGVSWRMFRRYLTLRRNEDDIWWQEARVRIWKISEPPT